MKVSSQHNVRRSLTIGAAALLGTALTPVAAHAQDSTWNGPGNDYNNPNNWTPSVVPTSQAVFGIAGPTTVNITANAAINRIGFSAGANPYTITNFSTFTINGLSGQGITNLSSFAQIVTNNGTLTLNSASVNGGAGLFLNNASLNGGPASLTLNGTTQLDSNVTLAVSGGDATGVGASSVGGSATTVFNDTSGADNVTIFQAGGNGTGIGQGGTNGTGIGGVASMTFDDSAHANGAVFTLTGGNGVAVVNGNNATGIGGVSVVNFLGAAQADGASFNMIAGSATALGSFDPLNATAVGGISSVSFSGTSHADNADFNLIGIGAVAVGGPGRAGAPGDTGTTGSSALAIGGISTLSLSGDAHANGATIINTTASVVGIGGAGGDGGTGAGGTGGTGQGVGSIGSISILGNAHVDNATITSTVADATGVGGTGGIGGTTGAGGAGGAATVTGGSASILVSDNASVNGTVFTNNGGNAVAIGGFGGLGGTGAATSGVGGESQVTGGSAILSFAGSVTLGAGTQINNNGGDATATGGRGGNGGTVGAGGQGGAATATAGNAVVQFVGNASAGNATIINTGGALSVTGGAGGNGTAGGTGGNGGFATANQGQALIQFNGNSTAGAATIENHPGGPVAAAVGADGTGATPGAGALASYTTFAPEIQFNNNATGGSAHITNDGGVVTFNDTSVFGTAAGGGARIDNTNIGAVTFNDSASLGNGQIVSGGTIFGGQVVFLDTSTAGSGTITNNSLGSVSFGGNSTMGTATVVNNTGGFAIFGGTSDGVAGTLITSAGSNAVFNTSAFRLGSLSGAGNVFIGGTALQVGYLDRNETFSGVIQGGGQLVKRGTGTLTLTGANTYTGNTAVTAGTLQIGNGGTTGSVVGDINVFAGANVTFNRSDAVGYAGAVSGGGSLTKTGAGVLVLTGTNTYTGGTTISQGGLQIGNAGTTGSITGNVLNNGVLLFNRTDNITFGGDISGTGQLTKLAAGTLTLTSNVTLTGVTLVSQGVLQIGNGGTTGSVSGNIIDNANVTFNRSDTITYGGVVSGTGSLTKTGAGTLILTNTNTYTGGTTVNQGVLQIGNGGTTGSIAGNIALLNNSNVTFNRSDTITYGGVVSGTGSLTKIGTGTLVLTGANTHSSGTFVNAGALELNGSLAAGAVIGVNGRLTGTGTVNNVINNNGVIAPGNAASPFGTLTATGAVTFSAGSFLAPTVGSGGQTSFLQAGSLTINGGQVRPTAVSGGLFLMQTDYRIANGTGGRTGTFTGVDESLLPSFLDASLSYAGNDVFLRLRRNATTFAQTTGLTPNQAAAGGSLDAAVAANNPAVFTTYLTTYNTLLPLSGAQLQGALNVVSGDALTAFPVAAQEHANRFAERLNAYTWSNSSNLWGLIAYGDQNVDGDGNGPGFDANGVEFQLGFNTSLGENTRLGLSVGMNNGDVSVDDRLTTGNVDTWSVGAQLRHDFGQFYASGQFTYSWHSIDSSRPLLVAGTAEADYDARTWTASGELGWVIRSGQFSIEPHLSIRHANTSTDAYSETGPAGALNVDAANYQTTRLGIGLRLANRTVEAPVKFYALLRYERETGDNQSVLDNSLPSLPTFRVVGTRLGDNILSGEVGAEFRISNGFSFFAAGSGHTRSNETGLQANAGLRVVF